jgi:hypothetical protein
MEENNGWFNRDGREIDSRNNGWFNSLKNKHVEGGQKKKNGRKYLQRRYTREYKGGYTL